MEIKIIEQRANPLLHRQEYRFEVAHATAATPKRDEVRAELAKLVHAPKDRVIVERMRARFGTAVSRGDANVYETVAALTKITREHILVRHGLKEKKGKATTPAEAATAPAAPPAEAPKAEPAKSEEPKAEPPKAEPHKAEGHKSDAHKGDGHKAADSKPEEPKGESHKGKPAKHAGAHAETAPAADAKKE
ncbi:MAG: hypothetical protein WBG19_05080 [Thermoplasmata archaeon]